MSVSRPFEDSVKVAVQHCVHLAASGVGHPHDAVARVVERVGVTHHLAPVNAGDVRVDVGNVGGHGREACVQFVLTREEYENQLTVAYISMMSHINDLVECYQHDARTTLVVTDEDHIITTNPLLARYVIKMTKM